MKENFTAKIISLDEVYEVSDKLANLIIRSQDRFDIVLAVARGGFPVARILCDFLNARKLCSMQISHYAGGALEEDITKVIAPINMDLKGKKVLLVDDVNDTGDTLKAAYDYAQQLNPALLKVGVLHEKSNTSFKADFVGEYLTKWTWIIYQWAVTEDILSFLESDNMLEADEDVIRKHLSQKYTLKISQKLLQQILLRKEVYIQDT